jgi:hypothetical protein
MLSLPDKFRILAYNVWVWATMGPPRRSRLLQPLSIKYGLYHSKHCLEELILTNKRLGSSDDEGLDIDNSSIDPIGSLVEFKNLRVINMNSWILIGREGYWFESSHNEEEYGEEYSDHGQDDFLCFPRQQRSDFVNGLPASIEHLTIRNCTQAIFDCVSDLFFIAKPPKLRTLKVGLCARFKVDY